ncbi:MAG: hypothetical protein ABJA87_10310 [bacterium]
MRSGRTVPRRPHARGYAVAAAAGLATVLGATLLTTITTITTTGTSVAPERSRRRIHRAGRRM